MVQINVNCFLNIIFTLINKNKNSLILFFTVCLETIQFRFEFFLKLVILHKTTLILLPLLAKTAFPVTFYTEMHFLALLSPLNGQGWTAGLSLFLIVSPAQLGHWCEKFSDLFHLCIEQQKWNPPFFARFNSSISHVMSWFSIPACNLNLFF